MIFITVGTQKFQFNRLFEYIDKKIEEGLIKDVVFAQIGNSNYIPRNFKYKNFLDKDEFNRYINESNLIICHAGVGTIINSLKLKKKIIVVPRLKKYKEHVDNHQIEIANLFERKKYLLSVGENIYDLDKYINSIEQMVFEEYKSDNEKIQSIIEKFIIDNSTKNNVLMIGSNYKTVKGGIVSVIRNFVEYEKWKYTNLYFIPTHKDGGKIFKICYFFISIIRIIVCIFIKKINIVHIHMSERGSVFRKSIIVKICKKIFPNVKIILHHHGAEFDDEYLKMSSKQQNKVKKLLLDVDLNIVLSNRLVNSITSKAKNAKVKVLYNSVKTYEINQYNLKAKNILFLGRLGKRKGTYDLLEVLYRNKEYLKNKNIGVYFCGDGDIDAVKEKISEYDLSELVKHVGWIEKNQKDIIMKETMINVLPSYNEGLPMTILETMAYGIPNISTSIASIPEVIKDGYNGFLINPGNLQELDTKIKNLVNNCEIREEISRNSFKTINNKFSIDISVKELEEIYSGRID